jgi:hypothetical protein
MLTNVTLRRSCLLDYKIEYIMIMAVAAFPLTTVDGESVPCSAMTVAGCPIFAYAPHDPQAHRADYGGDEDGSASTYFINKANVENDEGNS